METLIEIYKQKRSVMTDCRRNQRDKDRDIQKMDNQLSGFKLRLSGMQRDLDNEQSMNFKQTEEKKQHGRSLYKAVQDYDAKVEGLITELEKEKEKLGDVVGSAFSEHDLVGPVPLRSDPQVEGSWRSAPPQVGSSVELSESVSDGETPES